MTSQEDEEIIFPFGDGCCNDQAVFDLDHKLVSGEISLEEYKKKIAEL
ncbi:hypothetical protein [uncultured Methanobrevibacter sp.]|nr:hypothetical protein [uncultured Methanobrevibacter sp.]